MDLAHSQAVHLEVVHANIPQLAVRFITFYTTVVASDYKQIFINTFGFCKNDAKSQG